MPQTRQLAAIVFTDICAIVGVFTARAAPQQSYLTDRCWWKIPTAAWMGLNRCCKRKLLL